MAKSLGSGLGLVVVTFHNGVAAHGDLAQSHAVVRHVATVPVDDADLFGGDIPLALAGAEPGLFFGRQVVPLVGPGADGNGPIGFGQAVKVDRLEVELLHPRQQRRRRGCAAHGDGDRMAERVCFEAVDHHDLDGGGAAVVGDMFALE